MLDDHIGRWLREVAADPEQAQVGQFSRFVVDARSTEGDRYVLRYDRGAVELGATGDDDTEVLVLRAPTRSGASSSTRMPKCWCVAARQRP